MDDEPRQDDRAEQTDEDVQEFVEEVEADPSQAPSSDEDLERVRGG